jgi:hypothetical protein
VKRYTRGYDRDDDQGFQGQRHFRYLRPLWGADHFVLLPYDPDS